jgi:hypothetical protein
VPDTVELPAVQMSWGSNEKLPQSWVEVTVVAWHTELRRHTDRQLTCL